MRHGSLFSGIGGFDLAAEWIGWQNVFHCEWNPFGQKVLHHYWPNAISYHDITKTDFSIHRGDIDIITGGFPCQPYSSAGKRLGKEDERHLWPEMLRCIREVSPSWIVGENVRGLTNWNGGLVFEEVQADLEAIGYEVLPFLLPACAVNAPHRRDRIWFIANATSDAISRQNGESIEVKSGRQTINEQVNGQQFETIQFKRLDDLSWDVTNSSNIRQEYALENRELEGRRFRQPYQRNAWDSFPSVSPICDGDDGLSGRLDSITFPKWRNESIKAGGNAVVPQVVYQIFKAIELFNNQNQKT